MSDSVEPLNEYASVSLAGVALLLAYRERIDHMKRARKRTRHRVHVLECLLPSRPA